MSKLSVVMVAASVLIALGSSAFAGATIEAPDTPATDIHGAPGNTPGFGGSSANPDGGGVNGGDGIHDIDGGAPGQNGTAGDAENPSADMQGGIDGVGNRANARD